MCIINRPKLTILPPQAVNLDILQGYIIVKSQVGFHKYINSIISHPPKGPHPSEKTSWDYINFILHSSF